MPDAKPVAGVKVLVDGTALDNKYLSQLLDVTVRDDLLLPDTAVVRLRDPDGTYIDTHPLKPGSDLVIEMGARDATATERVFTGVIVALEPEFGKEECIIAARAYDRGFKLNGQRKSRTFQNQKAEDMVGSIIGEAGLSAGTLDATGVVHEFFQQSMETDWEFCRRLAVMNDFEFQVNDRAVDFRKRTRGSAALTLKWGEDLIRFRPRMSGAGQAKDVTVANHDPRTRRELTGRASSPAVVPSSTAADGRYGVVGKLGGGSVVVADRVVTTSQEASKAAQATLDRLASSFLEAEGSAFGDPKLRAGATVAIDNVGSFSGDYVLSQTTHRFGGGSDYRTAFVISGRTGHHLSDLLRPPQGSDWSSSLVIGIVTNNNDPDKMGRVRVKFPALGSTMEGWWARVATLNAGPERGVHMLPQPNDEVVVAFEHGDTRRPIVIGSLYNGKDKPPADFTDTGKRLAKFGVKTDHEVHIEGKQAMLLRTGEKMTVEVKRHGERGTGDYRLDTQGNIDEQSAKAIKLKAGQTIEVDASQSVKIKGQSSVTVESSGSLTLKGATIDIKATGPVNISGATINLG